MTFTSDELADVLRARLGRVPTDISDVSVDAIGHGIAGATRGVWRVSGQTDGEPWSFILKELADGAGSSVAWRSESEISHPYWWRREADFYRSALARSMPAGLRPPRCFGVAEREDGAIALWLEDAGRARPSWTGSALLRVARLVGRWQGRVATGSSGTTAESHPWLSRGWLREYARRHPVTCSLVDHPGWSLAQRMGLPSEVGSLLAQAAGQRDELLHCVESAPTTICHHDFHPANLLQVDEGASVVVIDWAYVGSGPLGADVANMAVDAGFDFWTAGSSTELSARRVLDEYVAGLHDAGWSGDAALARTAFYATIAVKYPWTLEALLDAAARASRGEAAILNGRSFESAWPPWSAAVQEVAAASQTALDFRLGDLPM